MLLVQLRRRNTYAGSDHRISEGVFLDGPDDDEPAWMQGAFDADLSPAFRFMCDSDELVIMCLRDQSPLLWPGVADWHIGNGRTESVAYVVRAGREPVGRLGLAFTDRVTISADQKALIRALSNQLALAICLVRLSGRARGEAVAAACARERQQAAEVRAAEARRISDFLSKTIGSMSEGTDLQQTVESILRGFAREIGAEYAFLFRHDAAKQSIRLELAYIAGEIRRGLNGEEVPLWAAPFPDDITPAWRIMVEMRELFTPEMAPIPVEEFAWPGYFEYAKRFGLSDAGHIVLFAGEEPVGSIGFALIDGRVPKPSDKSFIEEVAKQAALAIRMADLGEQVKQTAVAREREFVAEMRADQLATANKAMWRGSEMIAAAKNETEMLGAMLSQAIEATGATAAAVMRRAVPCGSRMLLAALSQDGVVLDAATLKSLPCVAELERRSVSDPVGYFKGLLNGNMKSRDCDASLRSRAPESAAYHSQFGHKIVWDHPFMDETEVGGWISLAFTDHRSLDDSTLQPTTIPCRMALLTVSCAIRNKSNSAC